METGDLRDGVQDPGGGKVSGFLGVDRSSTFPGSPSSLTPRPRRPRRDPRVPHIFLSVSGRLFVRTGDPGRKAVVIDYVTGPKERRTDDDRSPLPGSPCDSSTRNLSLRLLSDIRGSGRCRGFRPSFRVRVETSLKGPGFSPGPETGPGSPRGPFVSIVPGRPVLLVIRDPDVPTRTQVTPLRPPPWNVDPGDRG